MRRLVLFVICALMIAVASASASPPLRLPALIRIASKLSGLPAKTRPKVAVASRAELRQHALRLLDRDYPRAQQAYDELLYRALGLLAPDEPLRPALERHAVAAAELYDTLQRTIYVRRGASRGHVLHGLVHALQDQSFDLRRLASLRRRGRDAAVAATAAVEGHATLVAGTIGGRLLASHGGPKIDDFLRLETAFAATTGLRFVATLQNLGGKRAIFSALRRFPATTEQVFHVDAFLASRPPTTIPLPTVVGKLGRERDDTFGELDVRALLAVFGVPRLDHVGTGWTGGRTAVYRDSAGGLAVVLALTWAEQRDATEWADAVATYVNEAFDADRAGAPATTPCPGSVCWQLGGRAIAFAAAGRRTALVFGATVAEVAGLATATAEPSSSG